jgi:hypothetical protein
MPRQIRLISETNATQVYGSESTPTSKRGFVNLSCADCCSEVKWKPDESRASKANSTQSTKLLNGAMYVLLSTSKFITIKMSTAKL